MMMMMMMMREYTSQNVCWRKMRHSERGQDKWKYKNYNRKTIGIYAWCLTQSVINKNYKYYWRMNSQLLIVDIDLNNFFLILHTCSGLKPADRRCTLGIIYNSPSSETKTTSCTTFPTIGPPPLTCPKTSRRKTNKT